MRDGVVGSNPRTEGAALILAELSPAIEACAWLYEGDMRQRIQEAGVMVSEAVIAALD